MHCLFVCWTKETGTNSAIMLSGQFNVKGKNVVITGGSQGLGAELGRQMVMKGASSVVLIARTQSKLAQVVENIKKFRLDEEQEVTYAVADLCNYDSCAQVVEQLSKPDIVFLCAGSSIPKLLLDLTAEELQQGVSINYNTALFFTHAVLKLMSSQTVGHKRYLVYCSSILGIFPFIGYGQYAPAKAAIRSLSEVVRQEAAQYNIGVSCVYPGNFASEGFDEEEKTKPAITKQIEGPSDAITVEKCAEIILWWLDHGYEVVFTDMIGWFLSCGMLGMGPRVFGVLQVFVALLLSIVAPVYSIIMRRDIRNYFRTKRD